MPSRSSRGKLSLIFITGNITNKSDKSPALVPATTPTLKSKNYTTGRGGTGNIVENTDPETARLAQDVDVSGITLPEGQHHTGRGKKIYLCPSYAF